MARKHAKIAGDGSILKMDPFSLNHENGASAGGPRAAPGRKGIGARGTPGSD